MYGCMCAVHLRQTVTPVSNSPVAFPHVLAVFVICKTYDAHFHLFLCSHPCVLVIRYLTFIFLFKQYEVVSCKKKNSNL